MEFRCLMTLCFLLLLEPATKAQSCSNQAQACFPLQCGFTSVPSQTCDTVVCGIPCCCYDFMSSCVCEFHQQHPSGVSQCFYNYGMHKAEKNCSFMFIGRCSCEIPFDSPRYNCNVSTKSTEILNSRVDTECVQSVLTTNLLTPTTIMNSLSYSTITTSSTSNLITVTNSTRNVVPVIAGVLPVCLLLLLLLIVISSILACTLYRGRTKNNTERQQRSTQLNTLQTVENPYYAHIPIQSTDAVYSLVHEGDPNTTETSHHNTVLPPSTPASSLAAKQLQNVDEQGISSEYSVITQENILYGVGQTQNSVDSTGVYEGTEYSTVVCQDGKKVTVKMETPHTHTEEEDPGASNHGYTSSIEFHRNTHATEEEKSGAQDLDYFADPDILQQIRVQRKQ